MPITGTSYSYFYNHVRKEVVIKMQVGTNQPVDIVMSAEAFFQDIDFIRKDKKLAHWISEVRKRKDLPVDFNFGPGGSEITFDPKAWEGKMGEE